VVASGPAPAGPRAQRLRSAPRALEYVSESLTRDTRRVRFVGSVGAEAAGALIMERRGWQKR